MTRAADACFQKLFSVASSAVQRASTITHRNQYTHAIQAMQYRLLYPTKNLASGFAHMTIATPQMAVSAKGTMVCFITLK